MAIVTTARGTVSSTTNTTAYTTSSFTPTAGEVLVAFFEFSDIASAPSVTVSDLQGGSWSLVTSTSRINDVALNYDWLYCYVRDTTVSPSSMTVTFTSGSTAQGCNGAVYSMTGVNGASSACIVQSKYDSGASGTPAASFASNTNTNNATLAAVFTYTNPAATTVPSGWTQGSAIGYATDTHGLKTAHRDSGYASTAITWGSTESFWAVLQVEVRSFSSAASSTVKAPVVAVNNAIPATLIGKQCDKNAGSQTLSCTASVSSNTKAVVFISHDPGITVTGITDTQGNLYVSDGSIVNGSGTSGVTTTCYVANLARQLTASTDSITATFSASRGAACMVAMGCNFDFSVDEGNNTHQATGTAPSTTIAPAAVPAYGFVGCGVEGPSSDSYTEDADWTQIGRDGTTGGADASNISLNAAWIVIPAVAATPYTPTLGTSRLFAQYQVVFSYSATEPQIASQQFLPIMDCGG